MADAQKNPSQYCLRTGPAFEVVEGPFAGRVYRPGKVYNYDERPKGMCRRFKKIKQES